MIGVALVTFVCCCILVIVQIANERRGKATEVGRFAVRRRLLYAGMIASLLIMMLGLALPKIRVMIIRNDLGLPSLSAPDKAE
jgi:hypothetical protein